MIRTAVSTPRPGSNPELAAGTPCRSWRTHLLAGRTDVTDLLPWTATASPRAGTTAGGPVARGPASAHEPVEEAPCSPNAGIGRANVCPRGEGYRCEKKAFLCLSEAPLCVRQPAGGSTASRSLKVRRREIVGFRSAQVRMTTPPDGLITRHVSWRVDAGRDAVRTVSSVSGPAQGDPRETQDKR